MKIDTNVLPIHYKKRGHAQWFVYVYYMKWGNIAYSETLNSYFVYMVGAEPAEFLSKKEVHKYVQDHVKEFFETCLSQDPPTDKK